METLFFFDYTHFLKIKVSRVDKVQQLNIGFGASMISFEVMNQILGYSFKDISNPENKRYLQIGTGSGAFIASLFMMKKKTNPTSAFEIISIDHIKEVNDYAKFKLIDYFKNPNFLEDSKIKLIQHV